MMDTQSLQILTDAFANGTLYSTSHTAKGTWAWGIKTVNITDEDREFPAVANVTEAGQKHLHILTFGRVVDNNIDTFTSRFTIVLDCAEYHNYLDLAAEAQAPYLELLIGAVMGEISLPPMFGSN